MYCGDCGVPLESVDDSQIERIGKFIKYFCERHKPINFVEA